MVSASIFGAIPGHHDIDVVWEGNNIDGTDDMDDTNPPTFSNFQLIEDGAPVSIDSVEWITAFVSRLHTSVDEPTVDGTVSLIASDPDVLNLDGVLAVPPIQIPLTV